MKKRLSKEEYAKRMKEQRNHLYALSNEQLTTIVSEPHKFTAFLSLMASINYTVNNSLLVYGQRPYAKELKSLEKWSEIDVRINKGEKGIQILEPSGNFTRKDGSTGTSYAIRYVYDISQTDCDKSDRKGVDLDTLRKALVDDDVPIVTGTDISQLAPVEYDEVNHQMNVLEGISDEEEINGLFKAYAYKEGIGSIDHSKLDFLATCAGYMLSIRFNTNNYNTYPFTGIMERYFRNMNEQDIRNELNMIYKIYKPVKDKISYSIYRMGQS